MARQKEEGRKEGREGEGREELKWPSYCFRRGKKTKNAASRIGRGKCDACSATFFVALRRLDCPIRRPLPPSNPLCSPLVLLLFLSSLCHLFLPPLPSPPFPPLSAETDKSDSDPPFPPLPALSSPNSGVEDSSMTSSVLKP